MASPKEEAVSALLVQMGKTKWPQKSHFSQMEMTEATNLSTKP